MVLTSGCGKDEPAAKSTKGKKVARKGAKGTKKTEKSKDKGEEEDDKGEEGDEKADDEGKAEGDEAGKGDKGDQPEDKAGDPKGADKADEAAAGAEAPPGEMAATDKTGEGAEPPGAHDSADAGAAAQADVPGIEPPPPAEAAAGAVVANPTDPAAPQALPEPTAARPEVATAPPQAPAPVAPKRGPVVIGARDRGPPLDITGYLSAADLERVLGTKLKFRRKPLPGIKPHKGYNSLYYADARGKHFGVSVQVWRDRNLVDSRTRYNTMRASYSDVVETNRVTAQGFRAFYGNVVSLVFADPRRPMLAVVSCSIKFCTADSVIELSRRVAGRMH